jgi:flagellar M-ring protein FliF
VILALPERRIFEKDVNEPSASVTLKLSAPLSAGQVRAVRNLVAGAVPRLSVQRVTVVDDTGALLASGALGGDNAAGADGVDSRQVSYEERIRKTVQDIVEGVVGPGKARVQVSAEMDFNKIESNSTTYDPDGRVAISTESSTNQAQSRDAAPNAATSGRNVPDATAAASGAGAQNAANGSEERVTYVVSTTNKKELIEGGRLRRLSVAVAVDGVTTPGASGQPPQWAARDAAELERLTTLVRSAVGFDEKRGDRVDVVNVRFAPNPAEGTEVKKSNGSDLSQLDPMRGAELLAALIAALAFVFFVLRPLVGGLVRPPGASAAAAALPDGALSGATALPGPQKQLVAHDGDNGALLANNELNVDLARIRGDVKASSIKQVAEIVRQHPDESVAILRGWLNNAF